MSIRVRTLEMSKNNSPRYYQELDTFKWLLYGHPMYDVVYPSRDSELRGGLGSHKEIKRLQEAKQFEKNMNNFETFKNTVIWNDEKGSKVLSNHKFEHQPDYPCYFEMFWSATSRQNLKIDKRLISKKQLDSLYKCLSKTGFIIFKQEADYKTFVHMDRKIILGISACFYKEDSSDDDDEFSGFSPQRKKNHQFFYINFEPVETNKEFVLKLIQDLYTKYSTEYIPSENKFYMIAQNSGGLFNQETECNPLPIKEDRYDLFYGSDFPHKKILEFVTSQPKTGNLMLLHGDPGTGKSNYIKNIISQANKNVIYIPPSMLSVIASPDFITFMMGNKNSIILIEDAEEVLSKDRNAATNNLLGLTDGFLKDALNLRVIATFNCDSNNIDTALKRKGRLYYQHHFDKLSVADAKRLVEFCNLDIKVKEPMSLAEIFNQEENNNEELGVERSIGFNTLFGE